VFPNRSRPFDWVGTNRVTPDEPGTHRHHQSSRTAALETTRAERTNERAAAMNVDLKPLDQQVLVITGATSGIGLATARMAAERGAKVVLAARSEDSLAELAEEITTVGGDATYVVADVRNREDVREIARTAEETYGGFDTWVNVAGAFLYGRLEDTPVEEMREQFETNVWGCCTAASRPPTT